MTETLKTAGGVLAYDDSGGKGPLLILAPSIGDLRHEYRFLAPRLAQHGWRVVTMDLRGQGDSSVGWVEYTPEAVGRDFLDLARHLGAGPVLLGGCSLAAAAAVWAAVEEPGQVSGVILLGPSVRDVSLSTVQRAFMLVGLAGPWRVRMWDTFYGTLYKSEPPADFAEYRRRLRANLAEPGRFDAVNAFIHASKRECEARLPLVSQPALVIMGAHDPDFPDAPAEARYVAEQVQGEVFVVKKAGHYPQVEQPEAVAKTIVEWAARALTGAE